LSLVLDSSLALSWYFVDEQTPAAMSVLDRVVAEGAVVTPVWRYEIANVLEFARRKDRVDSLFRDASLSDLEVLDIVVDDVCDAHVWSSSLKLAERYALTVYDAAYLELAQRRRLPLATLDRALIRASEASGTPVIGI
jgi:predicted nucleic acid-binding protein